MIATNLKDPIACYFSSSFKYLEAKCWTYLTVFTKYFVPTTTFGKLDFMWLFWRVLFNFVEAKYWTYWVMFNKCFMLGPYLMDPITCEFFSKDRFKYLEKFSHYFQTRRSTFSMHDLILGETWQPWLLGTFFVKSKMRQFCIFLFVIILWLEKK